MGDITVGVAMPTQTSERWIADGKAVKEGLEKAGYKVDLQYAGDDIPTQQQQIDQMITKGEKLLIVASIDGTALANQLQAAADAKIPVIAYDRLIRDSENVDFYVTFDNYKVGVQQATSLLTGLGVLKADGTPGDKKGPFNVELFAGSLDDNNAHFFYKGAMDTLQPFINDGTLVIKSGQTDIEQVATLRWLQETAQARMENLLTSTYSDGSKVNGVLSPYDGLSRGIITALQNHGYGPGIADGMPVVTGQDAEIASVKLINDGVQWSTIFKDTRKLADQSVKTAEAFLSGATPEANDTESYDNGVKVVPSYLLNSDIVSKDEIQPLLIDSGYWTADEVASGQAS
jgi:putative multiple sugar transport system substrate-binding protein